MNSPTAGETLAKNTWLKTMDAAIAYRMKS
jgi:hypothetical protein